MRSIFRSLGKTVLFTLLIFTLTLVLTLGVSVWTSVAQFLDISAEYFTTIGLVEYMGTDYPNNFASDPAMAKAIKSFDSKVITNDTATLMWDESARALGYIEEFWRSDKFMPDRLNSVFVVGRISYQENYNFYTAYVIDVLYSLRGRVNTIIFIDGDFGTFERNHYYLVFGDLYEVGSPLLNLHATKYENAVAASMGIEIPRIQDITSDGLDELYIIPDDSVFMQVANTLQVTNNSILVSGTDNLMSMLPFHQDELYIIDGRTFTDDEYTRGDHVAVISDLMAARLGIGVGDTIDLSIVLSDTSGVYNSYWADNGFSYEMTFKVVGITNIVSDKSWYVYIPKSADVPLSPFPIGYTVGHAIIHNEDAAAFNVRVEPIMKDRFQLTIYDQGYSNVAIPFNTILGVSEIVTFVCVLVVLAVLILFGFLFVYRQRETSEIMLSLGAGRMRVCGYFLFSAGLISLIATSAGSVAGYFLHDGIISLVAKAAEDFAQIDSRFSNGNLSISRILEFAPHLDLQLFLYVGAAVFAFAILSILGFVISTFLTRRQSQRISVGPKKEHKTSHLGGGSLKYALLSTARGGARTMVVPILAVVVVIFFGQLATASSRYQEQLDSIYDNTTITGNYTAYHGKQTGGLILNGFNVFNLYRTGQISKLIVSISAGYKYLGTSILADGTDLNIPPLFVPSGPFTTATLETEIQSGPDLTAINDLRTSPEFLYADTILMNFLDGYDESFLSVAFGDERAFSCLVPTSLMEEQGIALGDTIRVAINDVYFSPEYKAEIFRDYDLLVVGSYEKQGAEDTIYAPLSLQFDTSLIWDEGQATIEAPTKSFDTGYTISDTQKYLLQRITFNSTHFTLLDTHSLGSLKDYLTNYGYSQAKNISKLREFIVLEDASLNNSVASVQQQIQYINILYPILYGLTGIIAVVVSYLMVISRKMEFAIMRGLGTTRVRSFLSFFNEQSLLCILGILIGFSIWLFVWGIPGMLHIALTAGFFICYLLGSAISITIMNHTNVLTILSDKD